MSYMCGICGATLTKTKARQHEQCVTRMWENINVQSVEKMQAVADRRNLLSRCLLTVPTPNQLEVYLHSGKLTDDRFRLPWTKAKLEKEFLSAEAAEASIATCVLVHLNEISTSKLEEYSIYIGNADEIDVVPSSNPSSPDTYITDQKMSWTATRNIFLENYNKVDLKQYCTVNDSFSIEVVSEENHLKELVKKLPSVSTLKKRLRPVQVRDPLAQCTEHYANYDKEDLRLSKEEDGIPVLQGQYSDEIFLEKFETLILPCQKMTEFEIENVFTPPCSQTKASSSAETMELSSAVVGPQEKLPLEMEDDVADVIQNYLHPPQNCLNPEWICFSPICTENSSFLHVNEIIITEEDKFCDKATLDIPVDDTVERGLRIPKLQLPLVDKLQATDSPSIGFLNEKEKQLLTQKTLSGERFCDEIQASRLPELPVNSVEEAFSKDETFCNDGPVDKARDVLDMIPYTDLGQTELSLPWDIVKIGSKITDTSKVFAELTVDKDCEIAVKDVENIEKYSGADLYDWKDPMISLELDAPSCYRKVSCETGANHILEDNKKPDKQIQSDEIEAPKCQAALPVVGNDPLNDFMALRMNMFSSAASQPARIEKQNTKTLLETKVATIPSLKDTRPVSQGRKKTKHHVVSVKLSDLSKQCRPRSDEANVISDLHCWPLIQQVLHRSTDDFQQVIDLLAEKASYMIHALKLSGDLSQSCSFEILTPDMTRFLLKQKEKQIQDENLDTDDTYRNIVGLHALSGATDITANCCLESGIAYISAIQEKYSSTLTGLLTDVRQKLFEVKAVFMKRQIHHPKVVTLCKEIEVWLKKKRAKSGDTEQKILVLVRRDLPSLLTCLKNVLGLGQLLIPEILISSCSETIIKSLDEHNCLIAYSGLVDDNFPWAQFCLVVEYEYQSDSVWKDHCERQNIRHIAVKLNTGDRPEPSTDLDWRSHDIEKQITLIASQNITKNIELLQMLEARHNIVLIERDYSLIDGCEQLCFPDIDVDEGCGIVLSLLTDLKDDCMVQAIVTKIIALSLKVTSCWILLYSDKPNCYQFPGIIVSNLTKLEAAIANISSKKDQIEVQVLMCSDLAEVAGNIRGISEHCMTSYMDRSSVDWLSRTWLTEEISQAEKFLMMMPPITSFNAQLMLEKFSLKELFNSDLQELSTRLPWIPVKILKILLKVANNIYGLHLQDYKEESRQVSGTSTKISLHDDKELELEESDKEENSSKEQYHKKEEIIYLSDTEGIPDKIIDIEKEIDEQSRQTQQLPVCYSANIRKSTLPDVEKSKYTFMEKFSNTAAERESNGMSCNNENQNYADFYYNNAKTLQTSRKSMVDSVSSCKTNKEDWILLENFILAGKNASAGEASNNSLQRCRDDYHDSGAKMPRDSVNGNCFDEIQGQNNGTEQNFEKTSLPSNVLSSSVDSLNRGKNKQNVFDNIKNIQPMKERYNICTEQEELLINKPKLHTSINYPTAQAPDYDKLLNQTNNTRMPFNQNLCADNENITLFHHRTVTDKNSNRDGRLFLPKASMYGGNSFNEEDFKYPKRVTGKDNECKSDIQHQFGQETTWIPAEYLNDTVFRHPKQLKTSFMSSNRSDIFHKQNIQAISRIDSDPADDILNVNNGSGQSICQNREVLLSMQQMMPQTGTERDTGFILKDYPLSVLLNHTLDSFDSVGEKTVNNRTLGDRNKRKLTISSADLNSGAENYRKSKYFADGNIFIDRSNDVGTFENRCFLQTFRENDDKEFRELEKENINPMSDFDQISMSNYLQNRFMYEDHDTSTGSHDTMIQNTEQTSLGRSDWSQEFSAKLKVAPLIENYFSDGRDDITVLPDAPSSRNKTEQNETICSVFGHLSENFQDPKNYHSGNLYINPHAERLSQRLQFSDLELHKTEEKVRTLEDDLRETTRKLLANSQQFSRFKSSNDRHPMQKLNIGLATPLHRDNSLGMTSVRHSEESSSAENRILVEPGLSVDPAPRRSTERPMDCGAVVREDTSMKTTLQQGTSLQHREQLEPTFEQEQRVLMKQSPWTTDDSPPMDLDFVEDSPQRTESTNRAVFTRQTPRKKRKLTYQVVPGRKGQTRLVFQ